MARLFVAIELPQHVRETLANMRPGVPRVRWVDMDEMHLTLRFIGEAPDSRYDDIVGALAGVESEAFSFSLNGAGWFPPRGEPRTLWVGVAPCPPLTALQARIEAALQAAGLPPEGRAFHAHVTLARFKERVPLGAVTDFVAGHALFGSPPVHADAFHLFSSELRREGAIHTCEASFDLGDPTS